MAVITMSRQIESGDQQLSQLLGSEIGPMPSDPYAMPHVASEMGASPADIVKDSEAEYVRRGFCDEYLRLWCRVSSDDATGNPLVIRAGRLTTAEPMRSSGGLLPPSALGCSEADGQDTG